MREILGNDMRSLEVIIERAINFGGFDFIAGVQKKFGLPSRDEGARNEM